MLACPLPLYFLGTYCLSSSSLGCKALYILMSFFFFVSGPFIRVLLWSTLGMIPSIYWGGQPRYLSLWWDFCYVLWFRKVFSFSWGILYYFFFHLHLLDGVRSQYSQIIVGFFFSDLLILFLPSYVVFRFSLLTWHIFLWQISSLCLDSIFLLPVLEFPFLSHF